MLVSRVTWALSGLLHIQPQKAQKCVPVRFKEGMRRRQNWGDADQQRRNCKRKGKIRTNQNELDLLAQRLLSSDISMSLPRATRPAALLSPVAPFRTVSICERSLQYVSLFHLAHFSLVTNHSKASRRVSQSNWGCQKEGSNKGIVRAVFRYSLCRTKQKDLCCPELLPLPQAANRDDFLLLGGVNCVVGRSSHHPKISMRWMVDGPSWIVCRALLAERMNVDANNALQSKLLRECSWQ